ncbi:hypothetical protein N7470_000925 [Penicillium chermesinum]|nr:hypothetical protein N7470_000925 [Penicillium chermesinum]
MYNILMLPWTQRLCLCLCLPNQIRWRSPLPSPNSPESYSSPPVAQAPSNHPTEATVSTTPLRALSTECSAPADTTEALAINASGGAQADQPAHVPAPGPPDQQLLQTIQPAPSPTAQQTHQPTAPLEPESTPSTAVLLPAKTGRNVPKQQSGPHDATLVSVSNGRTEEIPQPSQVPADGMNPHSHTPELTDIGTSARGAIPPEGQINWKQWKQKCNRLDQQTQDDTLRVNSFLVTPRITLLRDAISFNDSFYLVLHQLYCLRSHDESFFLERFPMFRTEEYRRGMDRMQDLLAPNQKLPPAILLQFVKFPDTLDIMMSQPWYNYQVQEVGKFLSRLDQIAPNFRTHFYEFVSDRGYPPLMSEMALLFKVTPLVILSVIYLSTFRQLYADRYLPELSRLLRHEMTVSQLQSSTERSKKILMIIDAYKKIPIERQLQEHPIASPPSIALPAFDGSGPVQQLKEPKGPNPTTRPQPQVTRSIETPTTVSAPINRPGSAPSTRPLRWQTPPGAHVK